MADFHEKGFAYVQIFDPQIALDAWDDVDQYELHKLVGEKGVTPWNVLTPPDTPKFNAFIQEIEKVSNGLLMIGTLDINEQNMPLCWERYGKRWMNPEMIEQHLDLFSFSKGGVVNQHDKEHIWIWVPLIPVSRNQGLPSFMEGTHRHTDIKADRPYDPILKPGSAFMFDARLRTKVPAAGGGVLLARAYDVAKI